nr:hypothetical protein [Paracoccus saliphilus]
MSSGLEIVRFSWMPDLPEGTVRVYDTTWSTPQVRDKFPHDRVGYLVGTGLLYRRWMKDVYILPAVHVELADGREGMIPFSASDRR